MIDARLLNAVGALITGHARLGHIPLIGIAGAQGSGKTTLARLAAERWGAAHLSLDDVYLTKAEREAKGHAVHPLFAVRGPPGTHDLRLLEATVEALRAAGPDGRTPLPAFDKLSDDRRPEAEWPVYAGRPTAVLVDGWCLGATGQGEADLPHRSMDWNASGTRRGCGDARSTLSCPAPMPRSSPGLTPCCS